jgi:hypothetical protein
VSEESSTPVVGKGRPTPKRQPSRGPVAPPPMTRREAAKRLREANATKRKQVRAGYSAGDDAYLLKRDQGPVRALVRDLVDSRRSVLTFLMPAAVIPIVAGLVFEPNSAPNRIAGFLWVLAIVLGLADGFAGSLRIRREVSARFPEEKRLRGHVGYGIMRMLQFRRLRVPKPVVEVDAKV